MEIKTFGGDVFATMSEQRDGDYDKMQLQLDFMDCWQTALGDPMNTRVIIDLDIEDEENTWMEEDGTKHSLNKYIMIDGGNGDKLNHGHLWLFSSSWGDKRDGFIKPEEVLPRALKVIDSGHVKEIYKDGY